jgi:hypothetical protein
MTHPASEYFETLVRQQVIIGIEAMKTGRLSQAEGRDILLRTITTIINEIDVGMEGFRSDAISLLQIADTIKRPRL